MVDPKSDHSDRRKTAVGYVRVACTEQAKTNGTRSANAVQEERINALAKTRNLKLRMVVADIGRSGNPEQRQGIKMILADCAKQHTDYCLVASTDRIARDLTTRLAIIGRLAALGTAILVADDTTPASSADPSAHASGTAGTSDRGF